MPSLIVNLNLTHNWKHNKTCKEEDSVVIATTRTVNETNSTDCFKYHLSISLEIEKQQISNQKGEMLNNL